MSAEARPDHLREELVAVLGEDAHNTRRLIGRLDAVIQESGVGIYSALLLILTNLSFEDEEAQAHWEAILAHRKELSSSLGREAGVRMAALDYFVNINRQLTQPTLIDLELLEASALDSVQDKLTGLTSDRTFRSSLYHELRRARRYDEKTTLIVFDLDDFSVPNERLGSLIGDRLLRETATLLTANIRDTDLAARTGEDEMVLLLPETDRNGALLVAERVRSEVESFFARRECNGEPVGLTISAGVAGYPADATTPETLLERAALALYEAKAQGKNAIQLYGPERRTYLRFDLEPGRFEIEVLGSARRSPARLRNLSRSGLLFVSPEALELGEEIEIRPTDLIEESESKPPSLRGRVVRLEDLSGAPSGKAEGRFEIGVALDRERDDPMKFLERVRGWPA